jgi:hypothetical protein
VRRTSRRVRLELQLRQSWESHSQLDDCKTPEARSSAPYAPLPVFFLCTLSRPCHPATALHHALKRRQST